MKNISLSFLTVVGFVLVSCGTSTYTSNSNGGYVNSIYYTADAGAATSPKTRVADVKTLQGKTTSYARSRVDTIYVGDANIVNIDYDPSIDYAVVDDQDSYEARLRKFDSPTYTINIQIDPWDFAWYNPFYAGHGWYRPYGITWGTGWYNPYWGWYYTWRPGWGWSIGWGWDWWYGYNWGWGGWYEPHWHYPWHHGWWDGPRPPRRNIYYGRRDAIGTRRDNMLGGGSPRGSVNTGSRNVVGTRNAVGSASRRTAPSQIRGGNTPSTRNANAGSNAGNTRFNTSPASGSSTRNVAPGSTTGNNRNVAPRNGRPASSTRSGLSSDNRAVYNNNASSRGYNSSTTPSTSRSTATGTSRNAPSGNVYRPAPSSTRSSSGSSVNRSNSSTSTSSPAVGVRHNTGSSVRNSSSSSSRSSGSSYTPRSSSGSSSSRSTGGGGGSSSRSTGGSSTRR